VDGGGRRSQFTAIITVIVRRNEFPPIFVSSATNQYPYAETIEYTRLGGSTVVDVDAVDNRDTFNIVRYRLNSAYSQYFSINIDTGVIILTGDLSDTAVSSVTQFSVRNNLLTYLNHLI
jgi:hypothetical protein